MDRQQQAIEQLREAIENEVGRKMKTPKDFDYLSETIERKLHEHISSTTLKRMWGYLAEPVTPRVSTLDILSQFLGHADWDAFCKSLPDESSVSTATVPDKKPLFRRHLVLLAAVSALILVALIWLIIPSDSPENEPITFADEQVKAICVANWDTNGDGELSYAEAAAVTDIGEVFEKQDITSFDELQSFTGLTFIEFGAFNNCQKLKTIIIPDNVWQIREMAFFNCNSLESIQIPPSVTSFGNAVFWLCTSMKSITISKNVTSIGNHFLDTCGCLGTVVVEEGNSRYDSRDNCNGIIETATNTLIAGCTNTVIPEGVERIDDAVFHGMWDFASLTLPASLKSIGKNGLTPQGTYMSHIRHPFPFSIDCFGEETKESCTLYVPVGTREAYIAAGWTEELFKGGVIESPKM